MSDYERQAPERTPLMGGSIEIRVSGLERNTNSQTSSARIVIVGAAVGACCLLAALQPPTKTVFIAVFSATIAALLVSPIPVAVVVLTSLIALTLLRALVCIQNTDGHDPKWAQCSSFEDAFKVALDGFSLPLAWLVWAAFNFGLAVEHSGLGQRLALTIISKFGYSPYSLGSSLLLIEILSAFLIPSNTARGGALIYPLVASMSESFQCKNIARYLVLVGAQSNLISSASVYSGTVGNPIVAESVEDILGIQFGFMEWSLGASVPTMILAILVPYVSWKISGAENSLLDPRIIVQDASESLRALGPVKKSEKIVACVLGLCLVGWAVDIAPDGLVALAGVNAMLVLGVLQWEQVRDNGKAWDAFFWLAGMVLIVEQMNKLGLSQEVGNWCRDVLLKGLSPVNSVVVLGAFYFITMYLFSSITSHIVALTTPLLLAGKSVSAPPYLLAGALSYSSGLCACLTSYSSGIIVLYVSQGAFSKREWHLLGAFFGLLYVVVYISCAWWFWLIGWYIK